VRAEREADEDRRGRETVAPAPAAAGLESLPAPADPLSDRSVLALQRAAGNRAVGRVLAQRSEGRRVLARDPPTGTTTAPPTPALPETMVRDVDRAVTETISHAPTAFAAWNNTYSWRSKWRLRLNTKAPDQSLELICRIYSTASAAQKQIWENAITSKWSNKFAFCVLKDPLPAPGAGDRVQERYPIKIAIAWLDSATGADYTVIANTPGASEGGRSGVGGTTSMTGWGTSDTTDITHEFGHMLGCPEEYFTTNGVDYAAEHGGVGFRAPGAGVMNNPAGPALKRNFDVIRQEAATLRGVAAGRTEIA
jgi:hypothetical protein